MTTPEVVEFSDPGTRRSKALGCVIGVVLAGVLSVQIASSLTAFEIGYLTVSILVTVGYLIALFRAFRVGFTLDGQGITARAVTSTKYFKWTDLKGARTIERAHYGSNARSMVIPSRNLVERVRILPIFDLTSGKTVQLNGLRIVVSSDELLNWVDDAVREINDRLKAQRASTS